MAKKYIDAEAAQADGWRIQRFISTKESSVIETRDITSLPTADVVEVRHGRWIPATGSWLTPGGDPVWECSECGKGKHVYGVEHDTYGSDIADGQWVVCPNCGAKMEVDGE